MTLENLTTYQGGELAKRFAQSEEGVMYVGGALEKLAYDLGIEKEAKGFIDGAMASEEGIKTSIGVYSEKYQTALNSAKINELQTHYDEILSEHLNEEEKEKIGSEFNKFSNEIYGDINKKLMRSKYILEGEKKGYEFSDKQKESAKNILEKYKNLTMFIGILEKIKFENLRPSAAKRTHKQALKELVKSL